MIKDIKAHRDYVHTDQSKIKVKTWPIFEGRQNHEFFDICKKYLQGNTYKTLFEIGCAPWNYLIRFLEKYWYTPYGIEYSEQGYKRTVENLFSYKTKGEIFYGDFFDKEFIKNNKERYDVILSLGFIEHYDDPSEAIQNHFELAKKGGLVIITIPNLNGLNKTFVPQHIIDIHNTSIMNKHALKKLFAPYNVVTIQRYGGPINSWLYFYKNKLLETIRLAFFWFQRLIFDPIMILLYKLGIKCNGNSAPQWIIICKK